MEPLLLYCLYFQLVIAPVFSPAQWTLNAGDTGAKGEVHNYYQWQEMLCGKAIPDGEHEGT